MCKTYKKPWVMVAGDLGWYTDYLIYEFRPPALWRSWV